MIPTPMAAGLHLRDMVILAVGTNKLSLIGTFEAVRVNRLPALPRPFCVVAFLTNGLGTGELDPSVAHLGGGEQVYSRRGTQYFPDRFSLVRLVFRIQDFGYPAPGVYSFSLAVDGEWVASRRLRVYQGDVE